MEDILGIVVEAILTALLRFRFTVDLLDSGSAGKTSEGERVSRRWVIGVERRAPRG